jgi:hypothetical protein
MVRDRSESIAQRPYTVVVIVPTGIGAAIGGFAGDALPITRAIAQVADCVITHPNVLNGAQLYWPSQQVLYVEGLGLDRFAAGDWRLRPVHQNRVGLLLDQAIEPDLRLRHLQVANATQATLGLTLTDYVITDAPLGVELRTATSGATWGTIQNPDSLLRGAERLIQEANATAIAVVARFPDDVEPAALQQYRQGYGVDPLAGAEAVISHLIVRTFQVPCAHAPALLPLPLDASVAVRSLAEEIGYTFLPCVLVGLSRAPQLIQPSSAQPGDISAAHVDAVMIPADACGGSAVLSFSQSQTLILAVEENTTRMQVPPEALGIKALRVRSYLEAIGILAAHRAGINPEILQPQIRPLRSLN